MLEGDEFPIFTDGWVLLLAGIADNDGSERFEFEGVVFVGLDEGGCT